MREALAALLIYVLIFAAVSFAFPSKTTTDCIDHEGHRICATTTYRDYWFKNQIKILDVSYTKEKIQ